MTQLGYDNWVRFIGWLVIGLVIYVSYGYSHSRLGNKPTAAHTNSVRIGFIAAVLGIIGVFIFVHQDDMLIKILDLIVVSCVSFLAVYLISAAFLSVSDRKK